MSFDSLTCPLCGAMVKRYLNPFPTVDIIIELQEGIVLIERKNPPHGWALPGGFVDYGETLEAAAIREAREETSLDVNNLRLLDATQTRDGTSACIPYQRCTSLTAAGSPVRLTMLQM